MSKSLEALEVIECILSNHQTMLEAKDKRFEFINTIKQDLERLEELEKENEDLKVFVDAYANARDELLIRNEQLEKENLELKDKIQVLEQSVKDTYDTSQEIIAELKEEKEKWRKLCLCWREAYIECDEKFHNLLKEVLKDE